MPLFHKRMSNLVIVESPAKAATIKGYLGSNYKVLASSGHIRDLPKSRFGIDIENGFKPDYINIRGKGEILAKLKKEAKNAAKVFLATDPDREGEAISWHLASALGIEPDTLCRVTFNEITKTAIKEAIKAPRAIDENLVDAQQARRILDRILGYKLSPFLWKYVKSHLGAGRVQSVATRIIVERENEIRAFVPQEYWTIDADLTTDSGELLNVKYVDKKNRSRISDEGAASAVETAVKGKRLTVTSIKTQEKKRTPAPPFTTSTMQQEASRKLGMPLQKIMRIAQELYEGVNLGAENGGVQGLITYMRTDSLRISKSAQAAVLDYIRAEIGESYLPRTPRVYKTKNGAQDAHEAIRPSNVNVLPKNIRKYLTPDQFRLYKLIWDRFVASQMASAVLNTVTITFECEGKTFRSSGYTVKFAGYTTVLGNDDSAEDGEMKKLPTLEEGESVAITAFRKNHHLTEAPPRYTEASLIRFLEENGIGRPSTYAPIIASIMKSYVKHDGKALVPTPIGEVTTRIIVENFPDIVDYAFTADMENKLDAIESGEKPIVDVLSEIYGEFEKALASADKTVSHVEIEVPPEVSEYPCERCGSMMVYKNGKFGKFLACPNYPKCHFTKAIDKNGKPVEKVAEAPILADFKCEKCGGDVVIRNGKYGVFYACSNYPKCDFTRQKTTPIGVKCPDCGAEIISKRGRGRIFYSCEKYPECQFSSWNLPTNEVCPDCGKMLLCHRAKKTTLVCSDKACGYKCDVTGDSRFEKGTDEEKKA